MILNDVSVDNGLDDNIKDDRHFSIFNYLDLTCNVGIQTCKNSS